jgi:hypothetical protein
MARESQRYEEDLESLNKRLLFLQDDLAVACKEKNECDQRLVELDELVGQLLGLNEALVAKLSGTPLKKSLVFGASAMALGAGKKKKKVTKKSLAPRVASVTTASTEAGRVEKFDASKHYQTLHVDPADIDHLQMLHRTYQNMAVDLLQTKQRKNMKNKLNSLNTSMGSTASNRPQTRIARKKSMQNEEASRDNMDSLFGNRGGSNTNGSIDIRLPYAGSSSYLSQTEESDVEASSSAAFANSLQQRNNAAFARRSRSASPTALRSSSASNLGSGNGARSQELRGVIASLEDEYDDLNKRFRKLLSSVRSDAYEGDTGIQVEEDLTSLLQQLHRKQEQLRALKSPA